MKKYESNKARKMLLAALIIPVAVSSITPIAFQSEEVHANSVSQIPSLKIYELNGSPKLEWATEMLDSNILNQTSFENGQLLPGLKYYNQYDSSHSISSEDSFSGSNSYVLNDNSAGKGNYFNFPATSSSKNLSNYGSFYFPNGTNLSFTFKAKSIGTSTIEPWGNGGYANSLKVLNNKTVNDVPAYTDKIKLNSVEGLGLGNDITIDKDDYVIGEQRKIIAIDKENNTIQLNAGFSRKMDANEHLKIRPWRYAFDFNKRTLTNVTEWETFSVNTVVNNFYDYDVMTRGAIFYLNTLTDGKLLIDDIKFGYATEVEVYRDEKSIYKGFLSDFYDTTVKDISKPNKVSNVSSTISNEFNVNFNIIKPEDNGTKVNYQIQSIANNGIRSTLSEPQEIEVKTDVVKYKYIINNQEHSVPNIETKSLNDLSVPLKLINLESDYLHIQAIDSNGNKSDIQSFPLRELINMTEVYEKIKDVENSNNYNDFIDFVDEIEKLYGDNIPQDLKERIEELGKHHGVNTSFLLLEEGDFRITTADIHDFGQVKLTAKKQTLTTSFEDDFGVIDARGTQQGWNVTVSATPFTVETFEGFIGIPHQLPLGSLALNVPANIEQVGNVHNSKLPTISLNELSVIDGLNQTVKLLQAEQYKGMGEFKFSFGTDALALTVDAVTAKIDTVNYPDQNTPYTSTVTWDLISGPQL